ncbi:MAG: hypothetical protein OEM24_06500 [Paracoccaceae bacterium]|nr:hypothetical protein [Paracoccaceae bacterium]
MKRLALLALLTLAACGADGPPERPGASAGITVSGTVEIGVTGGG